MSSIANLVENINKSAEEVKTRITTACDSAAPMLHCMETSYDRVDKTITLTVKESDYEEFQRAMIDLKYARHLISK